MIMRTTEAHCGYFRSERKDVYKRQDSLKAIKLATAAKKEGILFDLAQLYDQGTIRGLAQAAAFTCEMDEEKEEEREAVKEEELEAILAAIES